MSFRWDVTPEAAWGAGIDAYTKTTMDSLYQIMVEEAPRVEQFMRLNAVWKDDCMPGREYLKAVAFRDDENFRVGIVAYYDLELYRQHCPEPPFDWGVAHETSTFPQSGVISIILPRRPNTVLGDYANTVWDRVRALYA